MFTHSKTSPNKSSHHAWQSFFSKGSVNQPSGSFFTQTTTPSVIQKKCAACEAEERIQTKLTIGQPDDQYEREADAVADRVDGQSETNIQRQKMPEEEEEVQRQPEDEEEEIQAKPLTGEASLSIQRQAEAENEEEETIQTKAKSTSQAAVSPNIATAIKSTQGSGQALTGSTLHFFESSFGRDFGDVKIHTDSRANHLARSINALAFTHKSDIYFNSGEYQPHSSEGQRLLAHELTHVVQQGGDTMINRYPATEDYRIRGVYPRRRRYPTMIFFDFDDATVPGTELSKITALASPPGRLLRLVGKASEEGNAVYNRGLARRRARAVRQQLVAAGYPEGNISIVVSPESGAGFIDYQFKRQVEVIPAGENALDPNCGANPNPAIDCTATYPQYSNFGTWLTNARGRVQEGINALDVADRTPLHPLLMRFFGDDSDATADDLLSNLRGLLNHIQNNVQTRHRCHNRCDASCASGAIAYNTRSGTSAQMTLCEGFFRGSSDSYRMEVLIHESVHGTQEMGGPPDYSYRWMRLFGTPAQSLGIPTAQAITNPDSIMFFLREVHSSGSTAGERVAEDVYAAGMNATQRRHAFLALAWLERWAVRDGQLMASFYRMAAELDRTHTAVWPGSPTAWHRRILQSFHTHFGTTRYPNVPDLRDREVYAGIHNRFRLMRSGISNRQSFSLTSAGSVVWDTSSHSITLPSSFFGLPIFDQIMALLRGLVNVTPGISAAIAAEYPDFADELRRANNVGP